MEPSNTVPSITTAPSWAPLEDPRATRAWREHWMQAVYFPREALRISLDDLGGRFFVDFSHDSVSMWFNVRTVKEKDTTLPHQGRPFCSCITHMSWSRSRISELSSRRLWRDVETAAARVNRLLQQEYINSGSVVLVYPSDATLLPLAVQGSCRRPFLRQLQLESTVLSAMLMESVYKSAGVDICVKCSANDLLVELKKLAAGSNHSSLEICVIAEPHSLSAVLPWNAINFWYICGQIRKELPGHRCRLLAPKHLRIWGVAMEFQDLWKIRAPVGANCKGFDLQPFDQLILSASDATDAPVEAQPLWEYAGKARSEAKLIFELDLEDPPVISDLEPGAPVSMFKAIPRKPIDFALSSCLVNAFAMWAEWEIDDTCRRTIGGPIKPIVIDQEVDWCKRGSHSGVSLFKTVLREQLKTHGSSGLRVTTNFVYQTGEPTFSFEVLSAERDASC